LLGKEIFLPKFEGYLSQWQFYLSHNAHENEADCDHRRTLQLLFHKIGKFQAPQLLFSLGEPRPDIEPKTTMVPGVWWSGWLWLLPAVF